MISIWIETSSFRGLGPALGVMEDDKGSRTNWGNIALLVAAAGALFHCISSLDTNAVSFAGNSWQDFTVNLGILCFAMFTLSMLVSDRSEEKIESSSLEEHGEPKGYKPVKKRGSSISWADQK